MRTRNPDAKCPMCRAPAVNAINRRALTHDIHILQRYTTELLYRLMRQFGPIIEHEQLPRSMESGLTNTYRRLVDLEERTNTRNVIRSIKTIVEELSSYDARLSDMEAALTPVIQNARTASRFMMERHATIPFVMSRIPKNTIIGMLGKQYTF